MNTQPEALRLADEFEKPYWDTGEPHGQLVKAAAELRRLHEVNQMLVEALEFCAGTSYVTDAHDVAEAALAKAKETA